MPVRALSREELIERGVSRHEAERMLVRASVESILEVYFERYRWVWIGLAFLLLVGMFIVLIWSEWVFEEHGQDPCDEPLASMLRILYLLFALHAFEREIIRYIFRYRMDRDGPTLPLRVIVFKRSVVLATLSWPLVATYMLATSKDCSRWLRLAVGVIAGYYALVASVLLVVRCLISLVLCMVSRGMMPMPRSPNAAPEDLISRLPTVPYDPAQFTDDVELGEAASERYSASCSICLDAFSAEQTISRTPCTAGRHVFHTECLRGWLTFARTCPLCRQDLSVAQNGNTAQGTGNSRAMLVV